MLLKVLKTLRIPDPGRIALFQKSPELGPGLLFFSGGSALKKLSQELIHYTHNSIHIITPFDSGGSSAVLRSAFGMPAVGDIRNRLMALADQSFQGNPQIYQLFAYRLPEQAGRRELHRELEAITCGTHPLISAIAHPMRKIIRQHLNIFYQNMPASFDLKGASIGNLVLAGGYLSHDRHLDPVIYIYSKLVQVRGTVRPVVNTPLHMAAQLQSGQTVIGQHRITAKTGPPLTERICAISLSDAPDQLRPASVSIREKISSLILEADLICYPMGSFFSSILVNLLPKGVGQAIAQNPCPKIFIPNMGRDPELLGYSLKDQIHILLRYLQQDGMPPLSPDRLLNYVLMDESRTAELNAAETDRLSQQGIQIIGMDLADSAGPALIDEKKLIPVLLSLA